MKVARTLFFAMLVISFCPAQMLAADKAWALYAPRLEYSKGWPEGSGIFILHVDAKTGEVISVSVTKSTGFPILDRSAVATYKRWRFRPGPKLVRIPTTF